MVVRYVVADVVFRCADSPASQPEPIDHPTSCKALDSVVFSLPKFGVISVVYVNVGFPCLLLSCVSVPTSPVGFSFSCLRARFPLPL